MDLGAVQRALQAGDWAAAERLLAPALRMPSPHPSLLYNYGKVLIELGRPADAAAALARVVQIAPDHGNAWFELGRAALDAGDLPTARTGFQRALRLDPADRDARRNLGRVLLRQGAFEAARDIWQPLSGDPEGDLALYRCAAELGAADAATRRAALLRDHPNRAAVIRTLVRVAHGAVPLNLPEG